MTELVHATTVHHPVPSLERIQLIDEADKVLQDFKSFMEQTYPKASSLYESAKWLWQDVHDLRTQHQAAAGDHNLQQVATLYKTQAEQWTRLQESAANLHDAIKEKYATVASAEQRIKKARGTSGPSVAALGFPTPDQRLARHVYDKKFKYKFHDAKSEISLLCDCPDGMLVQVRLLHEATEKMAQVPRHAPPAPKPVVVNHLDVADEADKLLQEFKPFMKQAYTKASALYERSKWLYQEVHDLHTNKVPDTQVVALLELQAETWTRLAKDEVELRESIDAEFAKVVEMEERVKKARGTYPNVAALGFPTPEQRLARHMYSRKFKYAFHDAKDEYELCCGFPDGLLTKVHEVHDCTIKVAGRAGEVVDTPASE